MSIETELNLSMTPGVASRLVKHPLLTGARPIRQRVIHTYFDTPDLRLQRERVLVQHRKKGAMGMSSVRRLASTESKHSARRVWEVAGDLGELDFSHVDDEGLRHWLEALRQDLRPAFTAHFTRSVWVLEPRKGVRIEMALERGWIEAEGRRQPICEVELDLLSGRMTDLYAAAGELQSNFALHPVGASKSQRGYRVLTEQTTQAVKAVPVDIDAAMTPIAAFRSIALNCLKHLQSNEQGLRECENPEFVHQARVAIRRLRSAFRVWKPLLPEKFIAGFDPQWQALARKLGETRNWDVFLAETLPSVRTTFPSSADVAYLTEYARHQASVNRQAAREALSAIDYSRLLLAFTASVLALPEGEQQRVDALAPRCLRKRARQVASLAAEALDGDAAARHRLRVAYKRLRYALEFFAPLFPGEALRNYHLSASALQEILGRLNDLAVASDLSTEALPGVNGGAIRHWLEEQTISLLPQLDALLQDFDQQPVPWAKR